MSGFGWPIRGEDEEKIAAAEGEWVERRRQAADMPSHGALVGLALSGGGIRSATLSLGVLKSLSGFGLLRRFDYLSTVSGGGYTGAFYCKLLKTQGQGAVLDALESPAGEAAVRHLRNSGRYLLPNGAGDAVRLATTAVRGWLAIQLVIGLTIVALLLALKASQALLVGSEQLEALEAGLASRGWPAWSSPLQWLQGYPLGENILLSPLWPAPVILVAIAVSAGWSYWLTRYDSVPRSRILRFLGPSGAGTAVIAAACFYLSRSEGTLATPFRLVGVLAVGAIIFYGAAQWRSAASDDREGSGGEETSLSQRRTEEDRVRNLLTRWTAGLLAASIGIAALALIDTVGQTIYANYLMDGRQGLATPLTGGTLAIVLIPLVRRALTWAQTAGPMGDFVRRFGRLIALLAALSLALVLASFWAVLAEYLAWQGGSVGGKTSLLSDVPGGPRSLGAVWILAGLFVSIAILIGMSIGFLNLSSFSAFYAGRLRRAYLGASNPDRIAGRVPADREVPGDDISLAEYYDADTGAPLHLVNVTLNETQGKGSSLVQRDRKGRPLTLSPAGYLVPMTEGRLQLLPLAGQRSLGEGAELPLSTWVAISGAAMSTGLGQNTSLGTALLAGLSNLRLGVWWTPPGRGGLRLLLDPRQWVQRYLGSEFLARFPGVYEKRWYLTDGGHFENTGVYELVRRRVGLIVACDNGADPDYEFKDIVNLTRKLRIDFGADLDFLPAHRLDDLLGAHSRTRPIFGELSELVRRSREHSSRGPYAAIGRIRLPAEDAAANPAGNYVATLILLKPRLSGLEMVDLLDYNRANPDFPQQTTGDQFFDEAQWESYFRLGATIADLAFSADAPGSASDPDSPSEGRVRPTWHPGALVPVSVVDHPWFADDWLGGAPMQDQRDSQGGLKTAAPGPAVAEGLAGAAAHVSAGNAVVSAAANMSAGRLVAGAIAAFGTVGLASGIGHTLASDSPPVESSVAAEPGPGVRVIIPRPTPLPVEQGGGTGQLTDAERRTLEPLLAEIIQRLNGNVPVSGTARDPAVAAQLLALRTEILQLRRAGDAEAVNAVLREMAELRRRADTRDLQLANALNDMHQQLDTIATRVRETAPRRNVRGQ